MTDVITQRYIRPWHIDDYYSPFRAPSKHLLNDNLYGITCLFTLTTDKVFCRWSICNGDNFSKKEGVERARKNYNLRVIDREDVDEYQGLTWALVENLLEDYPKLPIDTFEDYLNLFRRASADTKRDMEGNA